MRQALTVFPSKCLVAARTSAYTALEGVVVGVNVSAVLTADGLLIFSSDWTPLKLIRPNTTCSFIGAPAMVADYIAIVTSCPDNTTTLWMVLASSLEATLLYRLSATSQAASALISLSQEKTIFFVAFDKYVARVDLGSTVLDWTFTANSHIGYLVHSDNSEFVVFSTVTSVYALSVVSGLIHWTFPTTQPAFELFSTLGSVIFGQPEGTVTVLSIATGLATSILPPGSCDTSSLLAVQPDCTLVCVRNQNLVALTITPAPKVLWLVPLQGLPADLVVDAAGNVAVLQVVSGAPLLVNVFAGATGEALWSTVLDGTSGRLAVSSTGQVVATTFAGTDSSYVLVYGE